MDTQEFLANLDVVQSSKRCGGFDCPPVNEAVFKSGKDVDAAHANRPETCKMGQCSGKDCSYCRAVEQSVDGLVANLAANGIEVPRNILEPIG